MTLLNEILIFFNRSFYSLTELLIIFYYYSENLVGGKKSMLGFLSCDFCLLRC